MTIISFSAHRVRNLLQLAIDHPEARCPDYQQRHSLEFLCSDIPTPRRRELIADAGRSGISYLMEPEEFDPEKYPAGLFLIGRNDISLECNINFRKLDTRTAEKFPEHFRAVPCLETDLVRCGDLTGQLRVKHEIFGRLEDHYFLPSCMLIDALEDWKSFFFLDISPKGLRLPGLRQIRAHLNTHGPDLRPILQRTLAA